MSFKSSRPGRLAGIVGFALLAATGSAAEISGAWEVDGSVVGNPVKFSCTLVQKGTELSGHARVQEKDQPLTGKVEGQSVTFAFMVEHEGAPLEMVFTASLTSDTAMTGSIAVAGATGDFTAKRQ